MPQNVHDCFYRLHGINCCLLVPNGTLTSDKIKTTVVIWSRNVLGFLVFQKAYDTYQLEILILKIETVGIYIWVTEVTQIPYVATPVRRNSLDLWRQSGTCCIPWAKQTIWWCILIEAPDSAKPLHNQVWPPYPLAYSFNVWYWNLNTVKAFGGLLIYTSHRLTGSQEEDWRNLSPVSPSACLVDRFSRKYIMWEVKTLNTNATGRC